MENKYCFEISFPSIDLDSYYPNSDKCQETYHAHLFIQENEIRIFYCYSMHLDSKINSAINKNWKGFCGTIKSKVDDSENKNLLKIDFSKSNILSTNGGITQKENNYHYISIYIDQVKLYWEPSKDIQNSAEFYLNDAAIQIAEPFYTSFYGFGDDFKITRLKDRDYFYQLGNSEFRPELYLGYTSKYNSKEIKITKNPKIKFNYEQDVKETDALKYAEIVCLFSSFYTHSQINYSYARIHLNNKIITINKILAPQIFPNSSQYIFLDDLDSILKNEWQKLTSDNFDKLKKAIGKFNQSLIVDGSSRFLLRYNIIEICKENVEGLNDKFKYMVPKKEVTKTYDEALNLLLEIVDNDEKKDFGKKWNSARKNDLKYRIMLGSLKSFLEINNLNIDKFSISVERIKEIRDSLTHIENEIKTNELEEANNQLYWISVVLIANLMGLGKEIDSNKYIKLKS